MEVLADLDICRSAKTSIPCAVFEIGDERLWVQLRSNLKLCCGRLFGWDEADLEHANRVLPGGGQR